MKQEIRKRQWGLFETEDPPPPLPSDRQEIVLQLLQTLLLETTMTSPAVEDRHD